MLGKRYILCGILYIYWEICDKLDEKLRFPPSKMMKIQCPKSDQNSPKVTTAAWVLQWDAPGMPNQFPRPLVRDHLDPEEFQTQHFHQIYEKLLQLPDSTFQEFNPLKLEHNNPELFQSIMTLLAEEIPRHDFGLSLRRIKERNLETKFQQWLLNSKNNEERAKAALKRRKEEEKLKKIKQIFDNILTL